MSNFKGEIIIEGMEDGSRVDPICIPCRVDDVRDLMNLYSAAPEMLEALEIAERALLLAGKLQTANEVKQVITKAKGE